MQKAHFVIGGNMFLYTINTNDSRAKLERYISLGARNFRINFGRKTVAENLRQMAVLSTLTENLPEANIFFDLPGNKVRLGKFEKGQVYIKKGKEIELKSSNHVLSTSTTCYFKDGFFQNYELGDILLFSSGLEAEVICKSENSYLLKTCSDGELHSFCGITVKNPNQYMVHRFLSDEEINILHQITESKDINFNYVCPSFADSHELIDEIRVKFPKLGAKIIAKIESPEGVSNIQSILAKSDGIMLCRGDLSSYYNEEEMFGIGEIMSKLREDKIFIVATDFFVDFASIGIISDRDVNDLRKYMSLKPDIILVNETSKVEDGIQLVRFCESFK